LLKSGAIGEPLALGDMDDLRPTGLINADDIGVSPMAVARHMYLALLLGQISDYLLAPDSAEVVLDSGIKSFFIVAIMVSLGHAVSSQFAIPAGFGWDT